MLEFERRKIELTVGQMEKYLSNAYSTLINNKIALKTFPSVMLWGSPGVGKSQGVRQIAFAIEEKTGKKVVITDVRLLLFNPVDLRGIPTANADKTLAIWLKPMIFQMDESDDVINILFLDEISAASQSVQAAAYQITLDRVIGEHRLPENCIVIAAGNRVTDKSVAFNMPKALANRLCHIVIKSDVKKWCKWAEKTKINSLIIDFIKYKTDMLMTGIPDEELAFPTPRSWEMVSNILNYISDDICEVFPLIAGCVGDEAAYSFKRWKERRVNIELADKILQGENTEIPEMIYELIDEIVMSVKEREEERINNSILFAMKLPIEFRNKLFVEYLKVMSLRNMLIKNKIYNEWLVQNELRK